MPQIMLPHGQFRMHHGPVEMAHNRIGTRFGVQGLAGVEDARGPSNILPLVRGRDGWFYLDSRRAQLRGLGRLGDAAADAANYRAMAAQVPAGSFLQQSILNCAANPTPNCANAAATSWFDSATPTAESAAAADAAAAAGQPIPQMTFFSGPPPGTYIPTAQEAASAATGKPNQSVPPSTPVTPLPTGTGSSGGNVLIDPGMSATPPSSGSGGLLLVAAAVGLFLLMK